MKTIGDVVAEYRCRPEHKSLGADGQPCSGDTRGLLIRRPVHMISVDWIGKESNELEAVEAGLNRDVPDVQEEYTNPRDDFWESVCLPVLREMSTKEIARRSRVGLRMIQMILKGDRNPSRGIRRALQNVALREIERRSARAPDLNVS